MTHGKSLICICLVGGCGALAITRAGDARVPRLDVETSHFDGDPGWIATNASPAPRAASPKRQDFGYQPTNRAGKAAGEIGGVVWRDLRTAYYGAKVGPFTFDDSLACSGTLVLADAKARVGYQTASTVFVGFFGHDAAGWRPRNFVGFRLEGARDPPGALVEISYGTARGTSGGAFVDALGGNGQEKLVRDLDQKALLRLAADGRKHDWEFRYDASGGRGKSGRVSLTFDGRRTDFDLPAADRARGAKFDRCGIFNAELPGDEMTVYLDDMTINGRHFDFSLDPHWDGAGNRATVERPVDYGDASLGFSPTSHAGGRRPGEVGGRLWRVGPEETLHHSTYAAATGPLSLEDHLVASGRLSSPKFNIDSGAHFGWFNSEAQGWPPKNFVGVYLDTLSSDGRFATPMYGTAAATLAKPATHEGPMLGARLADPSQYFESDGRPYDWELEYDPLANGGLGAVTLKFAGKTVTVPVSAEDRRAGATFDRFGLFNMQDNNGKDCLLYLDDVTYTVRRK